ncbi:MAG: 50S ribosomal protein L18 [Candidatus Omnitrophica bacterium]|nr:50S ribosomal protein L18 [Candidatus Omnitrophota bacterium]
MDIKTLVKKKKIARIRRHKRIRRKICGTAQQPRLSIYISLKYIYVQLIDDVSAKTVAAASSLDPEIKSKLKSTGSLEAAKAAGVLIAQKAKNSGLKKIVFDRSGYKYHGKVKALADAAREAGLEF